NTDQAFDGSGSSAQSNSLQGTISVSVMEVLANGYLVVRGEKILSLNQGDEFIRVSGIIRPEDVSPDNTVQSTKVANVQIIYGGTGALADANRDGWMSKFFKKVWPF
ncbi:MAG: flagellar basal body L-ring protein FlgH, partial [Gammaproteobacteria bacterium]|nr:flagellar basal body L-ring protein FlgH [Gammaproteobacteria bacterium]